MPNTLWTRPEAVMPDYALETTRPTPLSTPPVTHPHICPPGQPGGRTGTVGRGGVQVWPMRARGPPWSSALSPENTSLLPTHGRGWAQVLIFLPPASRPSHPKGHPARKPSSWGMGSLDPGLGGRKESRPELQKPQRPAKETSAPPDSI